VDLRDQLLELLLPTRIGDELIPGARLVGASVEAGCRLDFEVDRERLEVEIAPGDEPGPAAARTRRLRFYYHGESGLDVCRAVAERAQKNEEALFRSAPVDASRVREVRVTRLLEKSAEYHTLSPYVGCVIGCRFCYAQAGIARVRRLSGLPELPWGSYADVRVNAAEVLARELDGVKIIKLCPLVSDPYQSLEASYRITRSCLEVLAGTDIVVLLLTRSKLILEDLPILSRMPRLFAGVSIPTLDDEVRAQFEPRAATVAERLEILSALKSAGVRTHAVIQPMLPGPVEEFADALAVRVESVRLDGLHGEYGAGPDFDRHPSARQEAWQRRQLDALANALSARSIPIWPGELPPGIASSRS
jgi:DNA repair photolyase